MSEWQRLWHHEFLGNELSAWVLALVVFLVTFTVLPLIKRAISTKRQRETTPTTQRYYTLELLAALADNTRQIFLWGVAVWLASRELTLPASIDHTIEVVMILLLWMQIALWVMTALRYAIGLRRQRLGATQRGAPTEVVLVTIGIVVWGLAGLLALENLGIHVGPLLAGLGIGGIALALAVQTVLGDLLASLSIALDKPFEVGDALGIDDIVGTVEHIGVKSTRLRSINGEQIILGNGDLLKARVRNFGRLIERRSLFVLDVHYDTSVAALAAVPAAIREIIEATPDTRFDRCHLLRCTERSLQFETVYFVTAPDFRVFANAQQSINLRILERFRVLEVKFVAIQPTPVAIYRGPPLQVATDGSGQQRLL
jgi:small-conductance mechanosensitive channel